MRSDPLTLKELGNFAENLKEFTSDVGTALWDVSRLAPEGAKPAVLGLQEATRVYYRAVRLFAERVESLTPE